MRTVLVGLALVAGAATAHAQEGLYIGGSLGASFPQDSDLSFAGFTGDLEFDEAFVVEGHVGYRFPLNVRVEASLSYRNSDVGTVTFAGVTGDADDDVSALTGFANVYYDFQLDFPVQPYVGGGIGFATIDAGSVNTANLQIDGDDTVFAFNLQAGASYEVAENVELFAGYRYIQSEDPSFDVTFAGVGVGSIDAEFSTHEVLAGVRVFF